MKNLSISTFLLRMRGFMLAVAAGLAFAACSEDLGLSENSAPDYGDVPFENADPHQTWMTSIPVQVNVNVGRAATITAQTIKGEKSYVLHCKRVDGNDVLFVDVPQSEARCFGLVYDDGETPRQYRRIQLTTEPDQVIEATFMPEAAATAPARISGPAKAATSASLYGNSYIADCGYLNFGSWAWDDIAASLTEATNPATKFISLIDYEMMARGQLLQSGELEAHETVYLSYLYGYTGQYSSRILGYYTYTTDYSDIEFHDIAEALSLDYLNGKAKVQYQLDGNTSVWYDANFDYKDADGLPSGQTTTSQSARKGDDAYNVLKVHEAYGDRVTAVRGLTFKLDIPQGAKYGFYLRTASALPAGQKTLFKAAGVPDERLPKYEANYSHAAFNLDGKATFRSAMAIYDNFTFMGLDDGMNGGDFDCNDVTFALSNARGEKLIPKFTEQTLESELNQGTLEKHPEYEEAPDIADMTGGHGNSGNETDLQSWTLAFENAGRYIDFDFNDVVLEVTPNPTTQKASVTLLAGGAESRTEIYYGERYLGEVHELFSVGEHDMVNTVVGGISLDPVLLADDLEWPASYTMNTHRNLFTLKVYDDKGNLKRIVNSDDRIGPNATYPQVLCIAGAWEWPTEHTKVHDAYTLLGAWAINFYDPQYWNWYSMPSHGKVMPSRRK